jgi:hypothetical protein
VNLPFKCHEVTAQNVQQQPREQAYRTEQD